MSNTLLRCSNVGAGSTRGDVCGSASGWVGGGGGMGRPPLTWSNVVSATTTSIMCCRRDWKAAASVHGWAPSTVWPWNASIHSCHATLRPVCVTRIAAYTTRDGLSAVLACTGSARTSTTDCGV